MGNTSTIQKNKRTHAPLSADARISERAYELWMERGIPTEGVSEGPAHTDWAEAEQQILEDLEEDDAQIG